MATEKSGVCRLEGLKNRKILCEILEITSEDLRCFVRAGDASYRLAQIPKDDGTMRDLEVPKDFLKLVHSRIHNQLRYLQPPAYLHSGLRGRGPRTNMEVHHGSPHVLNLDVRKFYPSCNSSAVFEFFRYRLGQPRDIAKKLTAISTYQGHIPTGSPLSQSLAFWSKAPAFDEIERYAKNRGQKMTLFVDDITISSKKVIPGHTFTDIGGILKRHALRPKQSKTRLYGPGVDKRITGNILRPDGSIVAPNKLRAKLFGIIEPADGDVPLLSLSEARTALGVLRTIRSIERNKLIYPSLHDRLVKHERECAELEAANLVAAALAKQSWREKPPVDLTADF